MTSYIQTLQNMCSLRVSKITVLPFHEIAFDDVIHTDGSKYVLIWGKLDNSIAISGDSL